MIMFARDKMRKHIRFLEKYGHAELIV